GAGGAVGGVWGGGGGGSGGGRGTGGAAWAGGWVFGKRGWAGARISPPAAPPRAPAVMPSMSRPASLNMPVCSATAQGSVATMRPYWLTVIFAAPAGVTAKVITTVASAARNHIMFPPFTPALIAGVVVSESLYIRLSATRKVAARRCKRQTGGTP